MRQPRWRPISRGRWSNWILGTRFLLRPEHGLDQLLAIRLGFAVALGSPDLSEHRSQLAQGFLLFLDPQTGIVHQRLAECLVPPLGALFDLPRQLGGNA